jgi:UDP-N-acetylmuramate dehydrogenase
MEILSKYNLKDLNTFHISAEARFFAEVKSITDLNNAVAFAKNHQLPILILGGGSNLLFTRDFEGIVIKISIRGFERVKENEDEVWVKIGAGEEWHQTVLRCVDEGLGGIENLSLIPGTVGAAPMQNIGAYGVELKDVFDSLEAYELETGSIKHFSIDVCQFGYRLSVFKKELKGKYVITHVTLKLKKKPIFNISYGALKSALEAYNIKEHSLKTISETVIAVRQSKLPDPKVLGNAGSFFKNPIVDIDRFENLKIAYPNIPSFPDKEGVKLSAAWLIEQAGWKGSRTNDAGVHEKHALILVNYGNAKGTEIKQLAEQIQQSVFTKFGVELEPEVNFV